MATYTAAPLFDSAPARPFASWDEVVDYAHAPAGDPLVIREDGRYHSVISGTYTEWAPNWRFSALAGGQPAWYAVQAGAEADTAVRETTRRLCSNLGIADEGAVFTAVRDSYESLAGSLVR